MLKALLFAAAASAAPPAAAPLPEPDPFAAAPQGQVETLLRAGLFGAPQADQAIALWLAQHNDAAPGDRRRLLHRLCFDTAMRGEPIAATACAEATAAGADDAQQAANLAKLKDTPPLATHGTARVPLTANGLGSRDAIVTVNGVAAPWIMDTGAEITVVSESLAKRIGVTMLEGKIDVGNSTGGSVQGGLGVVAKLQIGDATAENVPVFVLPDAQLKIGPLPQIQAIFGLPVFVAFHRAAWLDGGRTLVLGEAAPPVADGQPLYWHEEGIGVPIATARGTRGAHLDTGANETSLKSPAHDLLDAATEKTATRHNGQVGGAGGLIAVKEMVYPSISLVVAGVPMTFTKVTLEDDAGNGAARLGDDVVRRLSLLALDFDTMKIAAKPLPPK